MIPRVGDIVQVTPEKEVFGGCFVTVTEVKEHRIMGYVQNAGADGQAYIFLQPGEFEFTGGKAVWWVG